MNDYMKQRLAAKNGNKVIKEKKVYTIPKKSKKRIKDDVKYKEIVKELAKISKICEIQAPGCTKEMQGLNHKQKRSPSNLLDIDNLERSCNSCNLYVELNKDWAEANGHFISRFKK